MALARLLTIQTWAVFSVITMGMTLPTTQSAFAAEGAPAPTVNFPPSDPYGAGCANEMAKYEEAASAINGLCLRYNFDGKSKDGMRKCIEEKLLYCDKEAQEAGNNILSGDDAGSGEDSDCDKILEVSRKCEGIYSISPEDAQRNRKDIRGLRDDLRKERQDARKNDAEKQKQSQDDANKIMDEANKNDQDWAKQRKELNDKLRDILKQISADSMKTIKDMQKQLDDIDQEYIGYRNALRRKISLANDTELAWNTQCRAAANDAANQAEAELNKRMEAEALMVRNFRATSLAGKMRRDLKIKRQRIINRYNETLAKCLRGDSEPGASAKLKLSQAKNDIRDSTAEANDKAARLEKLREQIANNVNTMAQTLSEERQQAVQSNQQDMQLLDQAHQANQQRLQQRQQQMFQNQWKESVEQVQGQNELNQRLNDLMGDEALASAEYRCWRKLSKERAETAIGERAKAQQAFGYLKFKCTRDPGSKEYRYRTVLCADIVKRNPDIKDTCAAVLGASESSGLSSAGSNTSAPEPNEPGPAPSATPKPKGSNGASGRAGASQ